MFSVYKQSFIKDSSHTLNPLVSSRVYKYIPTLLSYKYFLSICQKYIVAVNGQLVNNPLKFATNNWNSHVIIFISVYGFLDAQ